MMKKVLHTSEQKEALHLWDQGKDTGEIAHLLGATEASVYNGLHEIREDYRFSEEMASAHGMISLTAEREKRRERAA